MIGISHQLSFVFYDTATSEIYTLSLHDALPISDVQLVAEYADILRVGTRNAQNFPLLREWEVLDRKSTRLNSSHTVISYAVFCLKKKKTRSNSPATTL